MGLIYLVAFLLQAMLLPEPTYKGPENIVYFRATGLDEEIKRDPRVTWIVAFYAAWSPNCINLAPIFSKLSAEYGLPNLKFGKAAEFIQYNIVLFGLYYYMANAYFSHKSQIIFRQSGCWTVQ